MNDSRRGGRSRAHHGHTHAGRRRDFAAGESIIAADEIGYKRLQFASGDRRLFYTYDAGAFAKLLLRTDAAANIGHVGGLPEFLGGADEISLPQEEEGSRNVVMQRTGLLARSVFTQEAALCLLNGKLRQAENRQGGDTPAAAWKRELTGGVGE